MSNKKRNDVVVSFAELVSKKEEKALLKAFLILKKAEKEYNEIKNNIINLANMIEATRIIGHDVELIQYKNASSWQIDKNALQKLMSTDADFAGKYHSVMKEVPASPAWQIRKL